MNFSHNKTIIVDFDDTLAFTENRNFSEAKPNILLINKLNDLFDSGWNIQILTARGSISCETREKADKKYRSSIEKWLNNHNVKYHSLSFEKPLGAYYIDDKGISPEDFLEIDIRSLEGGLSGSEIYTDGKFVHKEDDNAHLTKQWFDKALGIKVPKVYRIVGNNITMEYINHDEDYFKNNQFVGLGIVQSKLEIMKSLKPIKSHSFASYSRRIRDHAVLSGQDIFLSNLSKLSDMSLTQSFSHGDFGIKNMLFENNDMTLIDPISNVFGCTELDIAKFCASLLLNEYSENIVKNVISSLSIFNNISIKELKILIIAEITRVYKYHPNKNFVIGVANSVNEYTKYR